MIQVVYEDFLNLNNDGRKFKEKKMKKLIALVSALVMVSSFAYAADWNFYGSARVSTFWTTTDANTAGVADVDQFAEALQGNSRIGANVKVSDELTGRFEYGTGVNVRILWGEWNFGAGSFGVGQHYTPLNMFYSNQVYGADTDLLGYGGVYSGRQAMLRLKFGDFQIAATSVSTANVGTWAAGQVDFPAIEASYSLKMDAFKLALAGGYQSYELTKGTVTEDIDSYIVALGAEFNAGMFYLKGDVYMGQNGGSLIWIDTIGSTGVATDGGNVIRDTDNFGYLLCAGVKFSDMISAEIGYGSAESDFDGVSADDEVTSYYLQASITLAPGVSVVPEIGVIDGEENGQSEVTYFGAKWQINF
jgi:hypothetical protein